MQSFCRESVEYVNIMWNRCKWRLALRSKKSGLIHVFLGPKHGQELIHRHLGRSEKSWVHRFCFCPGHVRNICVWYYPGLLVFFTCESWKNHAFKLIRCSWMSPLLSSPRDPQAVVEQLHPALFVAKLLIPSSLSLHGYLGTNISQSTFEDDVSFPKAQGGGYIHNKNPYPPVSQGVWAANRWPRWAGATFSMSLALLRWRSSQTMPNYGPLKRPHLVGRIENMGNVPCASIVPSFLVEILCRHVS